jgi:hypothetical protein
MQALLIEDATQESMMVADRQVVAARRDTVA